MRVAVSSEAGRKSASNRASVDGDGDQFRVVASAPKTARRISRRLDSTASMTSPAAAQAVCVSGSLVLSEPAAVPPSSIVPNSIAPVQPVTDRRTASFLILDGKAIIRGILVSDQRAEPVGATGAAPGR